MEGKEKVLRGEEKVSGDANEVLRDEKVSRDVEVFPDEEEFRGEIEFMEEKAPYLTLPNAGCGGCILSPSSIYDHV